MTWLWIVAFLLSSISLVACAWLITCDVADTWSRARILACLLGAVVAPYGYVLTHPEPKPLTTAEHLRQLQDERDKEKIEDLLKSDAACQESSGDNGECA